MAEQPPRYSPSPWRTDYMPSTGFGCGYGKSQIVAANGKAIAGVAAVEPNEGEMYANGGLSEETFECLEANARLIAAAPELLAACKSALHWALGNTAATREDGDARLAQRLREAITQAEGT